MGDMDCCKAALMSTGDTEAATVPLLYVELFEGGNRSDKGSSLCSAITANGSIVSAHSAKRYSPHT